MSKDKISDEEAWIESQQPDYSAPTPTRGPLSDEDPPEKMDLQGATYLLERMMNAAKSNDHVEQEAAYRLILRHLALNAEMLALLKTCLDDEEFANMNASGALDPETVDKIKAVIAKVEST